MTLDAFHPAVRLWFERTFPGGPTGPQRRGWPAIRSGRHTLIAAPTGSGKTLAAFLSAIDDLVRLGLADDDSGPGALPDETRVLYVSPLKALGNDIHRNLDVPLAGIREVLAETGRPDVEIRTAVRSGDTPSHERRRHLDRPPHLFVTTPESLFILLTTRRGRQMLQTVRTVIVDEIHAVADDKRGSHLALTLERLDRLLVEGAVGDTYRQGGERRTVAAEDVASEPAGAPAARIGLSATQKPIETIARFLVGSARVGEAGAPDCVIVDEGHVRAMDLAVEIPDSPLEALASGEVWDEIYDRVAELVGEHRTTLVFVNTRRMAERVTHHLEKRLGEGAVTSHHGSLSHDRRLDAERRLKAGELKALVATASLELGIDVGAIELVIQLGSTRTIASMVQRVGRSGRILGQAARGRLFPLSRDELVECAALLLAAREGALDRLVVPERPLDILAQHLVAAAACEPWSVDDLYALVRGAWPFRDLDRETYDDVVRMLADGYATKRGRRGAWIHLDGVHGVVRGRRGARWAAITSGGAIPDVADYDVVVDPEGIRVGSINEDFAIESLPGDIFQLGNTAWELLKVETGRVRVADARGKPPTIPFWFGEAPARTPELGAYVSRIRSGVAERLDEGPGVATRWLVERVGLGPDAARQIEAYVDATRRVLGVVPTTETLVLERFFDEAGGMQLVLHAPFGGRVNRAWGLALRKRFCRSFNFELQAAANEDAIVLSLGPQHSFPLIDVFRYLDSERVREILVQALLPAPMFQTRWRWNAGRSLAILRTRNGKRRPAQLLRMEAEDLLAAAFPDAAACFEHIQGDIDVPDHPIVGQTVDDCLHEAMDIEALEALLARIEAGELELVARDVPEPSPMTHEILNARPYAFLDDAPAEERRTLAVQTRRGQDLRSADDLGALDPAAIERVRDEARPEPMDADEVHDAVAWLGVVPDDEATDWRDSLRDLAAAGRASRATLGGPDADPVTAWIAAERLPEIRAAWSRVELDPPVEPPAREAGRSWDGPEALASILRGRLEGLGPVTSVELARTLGLTERRVDGALARLEAEGTVLRGRFTPASGREDAPLEWCHRRLLARIHRYTIDRLRAEIEPATQADYLRFLVAWHHLESGRRLVGPHGLVEAIRRLQAFDAPAAAWERDLLPARVDAYDPAWLDEACLSGEVAWGRLVPPPGGDRDRPLAGPIRTSPVALFVREDLPTWTRLAPVPRVEADTLSHEAGVVLEALRKGGAAFHSDLVADTGLLSTRIERALGELVAWGLVTADGVAGLRALLTPEKDRPRRSRPRAGRPPRTAPAARAGRWALLRRTEPLDPHDDPTAYEDAVEVWARQLLDRYGVVARRLLEREPRLAPWRDVLRVLRRLEMRGEVRGGRFIQGAAGEQFALPEAVEALRAARRSDPDGRVVAVSGADPLNLVGILTPGDRVAALASNRVLVRDGIPIAVREGRAIRWLREPDAGQDRRELEVLLVRDAATLGGAS